MRRSVMKIDLRGTVVAGILGVFCLLAVAGNASAFPTWMGVYGSFVRHTDGSNPGTFTVLMNQDYFGLEAGVGIQVNGGTWTEYVMSYAGTNVDAGTTNSVWTYTPGQAYPAGAVVAYYFHGYDGSSSNIYDSNDASNYFFQIALANPGADPRLTSWFTKDSGAYARIQQTIGGTLMTTWSNQPLPAYSDVQTVSSSLSNVYVSSTGLASYIMGPWFLNAAKTVLFPNLPLDQAVTVRFPRVPLSSPSPTTTSLGAIGMYVNGVAIFNMLDAFSYVNSNGADSAQGQGIWNRDALFGEGPTFDPANAHQPQNGQYHAHVNPIGLRYELGDNALYNSTSNTYSETTNTLQHSPIIGWAFDGYPLYGPYGYSNPTNPASGVRRLVSGYVQRNGQYGTANLNLTGRVTLPLWAQAAEGITTLASSQYGPSTSKTADSAGSFAIGRYAEDNDFLGDLPATNTVGVSWDLDRYNGRYCVTPDYPSGTYAYFVTINADGTPAFPYILGRQYYGVVAGGTVTSIGEPVATNFNGGPNTPPVMQSAAPNGGDLVLTWSSVNGGTYQVDVSTNLTATNGWSALNTNVVSGGLLTPFIHTNALVNVPQAFYRAHLASLAPYDTGGNILSVVPNSAAPGTTNTITINLNPGAQPSPPPQNAPVNSVTVGSIAGTSLDHVSQTEVQAIIIIPSGAAPGTLTVTVVFPGPPSDPTNVVTYTLTNGFMIQ
jgi:hypothetical protein